MIVPWESSTPNTSRPVSVWVSKWISPTGPWRRAQARTSGSAIEWSPPSTIGSAPEAPPPPRRPGDPGVAPEHDRQRAGVHHLPHERLDRRVGALAVGGHDRRVAEVHHA